MSSIFVLPARDRIGGSMDEDEYQKMRFEKEIRWFFLIGVFIVALYLRLLNWPIVFNNNSVTFFGHDPYYHMRRILLAVKHFPFIPQYDYYINYPQGLTCHYGPFFDLMIAAVAILTKPFSNPFYATEVVAAIFPAIIGAFFVFIIYLIGKMVFDYRVGLIAAAISAFMRLLIFTSEIGRTDYHVLEVFLSGLIFLSIFYLLKNFTNLSKGRQTFYCILSGLSLALGLFTSSVMIIFLIIFGLFINAQLLVNYFLKRDLRYLFSLSLSVLFSALIILSIGILPFSLRSLSFDFDRLSLFQPVLVIFLIAEIAVLYCLLTFPKRYRGYLRPQNLTLVIFLLLIIFAFCYYSYKPFTQNIFKSWQYVSVQDEWLKTITEARPLFLEYAPHGIKPRIIFSEAIAYLGRAFFLIPLGFIFLGYLVIKKKKEGYLLFFTFSLLTAAISLYQRRFLSLFSISACILMALVINEIYLKLLTIQWKKIPSFYPAICVVVGIFLFSFYPKGNLQFKSPPLSYEWQPGLNELLVWLKENTPQTAYFLEPTKVPEYSVLSVWELGHKIVYLSRRPVVANNLHNNKRGLEVVARFILASDQNQAKAILEENRVKYIITTSLDDGVQLFDYARMLGIAPPKYIQIKSKHFDRGYVFQTSKEIEYYKLIFNRFHLLDGANYDFVISKDNSIQKERIEALNNFRLIYESDYLMPTFGMINKNVNNLKIFEYVTGANVTGKALPSSEVIARLTVKTNTGRSFLYKNIVKADSEGKFRLTLPYSTTSTGQYEITNGSVKKHLTIAEEDIEKGYSKELNLVD